MVPAAGLDRIRDLLGAEAVVEHAPVDVDGRLVHATVRPGDGEAVAPTLAALAKCGLAAFVRGGGGRFGVGNRPSGGDVIVSTERLVGVDVFEPAEGVCHVRAGTTLADVRARVNSEGWDLPLDPPGERSTLGGTLAAAAVGPRCHGYGLPRDAVLGLEVAFSTGERTRCGGRVVKNVTGYDLCKLYTGSFGSLAVIEAAWLRLRPLPQQVRCLEARLSGLAEACAASLAASRRESARVTCMASGAPGLAEDVARVTFELAGDTAAVERDTAWLAAELGASELPPTAIDALREHQGAFPGDGGLRFRIGALPSRLAALHAELRAAGAEILSHPGLRLVYAGFRLPASGAEEAVERIFRVVAATAAGAGGGCLCESAPAWAKAEREMHGDVAALLPHLRALKTRFDPGRILNPGRFAGGL
jgi:glycolate oxidase FAD binding subunit